MVRNADWSHTYCEPEAGNVRYPSTAREAVRGYAYVYSKDLNYVRDLQLYHEVQVWSQDHWVPFNGTNLQDREEPEPPPESFSEENDPNW